LTCEYYIRLEELVPLPPDVDRRSIETIDFFDKIAAQQGLWTKYDSLAKYVLNDVAFHQNYPSLREEKKRLYKLVDPQSRVSEMFW
jgi:hypothetical protein